MVDQDLWFGTVAVPTRWLRRRRNVIRPTQNNAEGRKASEPTGVMPIFFSKVATIWRKRTRDSYDIYCQSVTRLFGQILRKFVWTRLRVDQGLGAGTMQRVGKQANPQGLTYIFLNNIARIWSKRTQEVYHLRSQSVTRVFVLILRKFV